MKPLFKFKPEVGEYYLLKYNQKDPRICEIFWDAKVDEDF